MEQALAPQHCSASEESSPERRVHLRDESLQEALRQIVEEVNISNRSTSSWRRKHSPAAHSCREAESAPQWRRRAASWPARKVSTTCVGSFLKKYALALCFLAFIIAEKAGYTIVDRAMLLRIFRSSPLGTTSGCSLVTAREASTSPADLSGLTSLSSSSSWQVTEETQPFRSGRTLAEVNGRRIRDLQWRQFQQQQQGEKDLDLRRGEHAFRRTESAQTSSEVPSDGSSSSDDSSSSSANSSDHQSHGHEALFFLIAAFVTGTCISHLLMNGLFHGLQHTVVLFGLGMLLSFLIEGLDLHVGVFGRSYSMWMEIDPHLLLFTLLPPLVTGDAMTIDTSVAKRVAMQCIYMAGPGVVLSGMLTGLFLFIYLPYDWSFLLSLTTGAILCATDPVAVVALLKELGASPTLTVQIQGESLLNDGTAIVLYTISYNMLKGEEYDVGDIIEFLVKMAVYAWGLGALIGYAFFAWIRMANHRFAHHSSVIQASLTICCAYFSFIVAEGVFKISGVLCTVATALVLAHKMWPEVTCKEAMHTVWHMLEYLGNTVIFFLAGALCGKAMLEVATFMDYIHLFVIYFVIMFIRFCFIFASRPILKYLHSDDCEVSKSDAAVMAWGGLRGAIGLALAVQVSRDRGNGNVSEKDADRVLFFVSGIAALTLIVNASTAPKLVNWLGITQLPETKRRMLSVLNRQLQTITLNRTVPGKVREELLVILEEVEAEIFQPRDGVHIVRDVQHKARRTIIERTTGHDIGKRKKKRLKQATNQLIPPEKGGHMADESSSMTPGKMRLRSIKKSAREQKLSVQPRGSGDVVKSDVPTRYASAISKSSADNSKSTAGMSSKALGSTTAVKFSEDALARQSKATITSAVSFADPSKRESNKTIQSDATTVTVLKRIAGASNWESLAGWLFDSEIVMQDPQSLVDEHERCKQMYQADLKKQGDNARLTLLKELGVGEMPFQDEQEAMADLVCNCTVDLRIMRSVNEGFLNLVKAEYWHMIEHAEFCGSEAEQVLASITLALSQRVFDLSDYGFIEPFIKCTFEQSAGRLSACAEESQIKAMKKHRRAHNQHHMENNTPLSKFIHGAPFSGSIAVVILLNAICTSVEQEVRSEGDQHHFWLVTEIFFTIVFTVECVLKTADQKLKYFTSAFNLFDLFLAVLGIIGCIFSLMVANLEAKEDGTSSVPASEARMVRTAQVFRIMRIIRLFRLYRFWILITSKLTHKTYSVKVAENMQKAAILKCFCKAHLKSQERIVRFFGNNFTIDSVELARCVMQSQVAVYKAYVESEKQMQHLEQKILDDVNRLHESLTFSQECEQFVMDAHKGGIISAHEAETILHPLHHSMSHFLEEIKDWHAGHVSASKLDTTPKKSGQVSSQAANDRQVELLVDEYSDDSGEWGIGGIGSQFPSSMRSIRNGHSTNGLIANKPSLYGKKQLSEPAQEPAPESEDGEYIKDQLLSPDKKRKSKKKSSRSLTPTLKSCEKS